MIESILSAELLNVSMWMADNRLSLHLEKTESILFGTKIKLKKALSFEVRVEETVITAKELISYLGCMLDCHMSGVGQALKVITKVNQRARYMARISKFLDERTKIILAGALIQPYFDYACGSWYNGVTSNLKHRLQTSQNKLIRLILDLPIRTHLETCHFERVGWLRVEDRVHQLQLGMIHKIVYGDVPKYFRNYFNKVNEVHRYSTRGSATDFIPPRVKTNLGKQSFLYVGATLWNGLPSTLKTVRSIGSFKKGLKVWLRCQT